MLLFTPESPDIASNVIQFLVDVSKALQTVENPLLDAALLNILPFIAAKWDPARIYEDIYRRMYFPFRRRQKSRPSYRAHTFELLDRIRLVGLSAVVEEVNERGSWVYFLQPIF
jgi:hypothetical protein